MTRRTGLNLAVVSAFGIACLTGLLYLALNVGLHYPAQPGYRLSAEFQEASGLVPQDEVRISGVKVGTVLNVGSSSSGRTLVAMELDPRYQLRSDVRAIVRPKSLLGTSYIELVRTPRSQSGLLASGSTIPVDRTGQAVQIDDVLNNLDPPTRKAMSDSFQQLGVALEGRASDVNSSLPAVDQVAQNLRPLAEVGDRRTEELARILVDLDTIMQALADEQDSLGRIVDSGNRVFSGVAQRDEDLAGAVQNGNAFLGSLDTTFSSAGVTGADRTSLTMAPDTLRAGSHTLSLTNANIDRLLPELLLGQVNYPSNQLNLSQADSETMVREWISAFSQCDANACSFRITSITPGAKPPAPPSASGPSLPTLPALPTLPGLPLPTPSSTPDPLCILVGGHC